MNALDHTQAHSELVGDIYTKRAKTYDDSWHPDFAKELVKFIDPPLTSGSLVIDLACGTGLVTYLLLEKVAPHGRIWGIDVSAGMLAIAKQKQLSLVEEHRPCLQLIEHDMVRLDDIEDIKHRYNAFDLITCASALVLLEHPEEAISRWAKYLKHRTGLLLFDVIIPDNMPGGLIFEKVARKIGLSIPYHRTWILDEDSLRQRLANATDEMYVESITFVEQQGWRTRTYEATSEEATIQFDKSIDSIFYSNMTFTAETREYFKMLFTEEWIKCADAQGTITEIDGTWVVKLRKR